MTTFSVLQQNCMDWVPCGGDREAETRKKNTENTAAAPALRYHSSWQEVRGRKSQVSSARRKGKASRGRLNEDERRRWCYSTYRARVG